MPPADTGGSLSKVRSESEPLDTIPAASAPSAPAPEAAQSLLDGQSGWRVLPNQGHSVIFDFGYERK